MPLKKLSELPQSCLDPEHDPPRHIKLDPGVYEHECPACGRRVRFYIPRIICSVWKGGKAPRATLASSIGL